MIREKIEKLDKKIFIIAFLSVLYFVFMLKFYMIEYYVPDFGAYYTAALNGNRAYDGFSSLFLLIAGFTDTYPTQINILCLLLLSSSLFNMSLFLIRVLKDSKYIFLNLITLYGCSVWYYFYGKLFYDFPFTAYSYSICLLLVADIWNQDSCKNKRMWNILCLTLGFCLSWKPYNIFCVAGLGLLLLCKEKSRNYIFRILCSINAWFVSVLFFVIGYIIGNYNLLIDPINTLSGIRGYQDSYNFVPFLFGKTRQHWDHINDMSFTMTVFCLITAIIIMFVIPILTKKWGYFLTSAFLTVCMVVFINCFSRGYAWHGFPMGLYIITLLAFMSDEHIESNVRVKSLLALGLFSQLVVCFCFYIPKQYIWYQNTQKAISVFETENDKIFDSVIECMDDIKGKTFKVETALKRYKPIALYENYRKPIGYDHTYITYTTYQFVDPLRAGNYMAWNSIENADNYSNDESDYLIWIVPNDFMTMADVVPVHIYDDREKVKIIARKGYTIFLLR